MSNNMNVWVLMYRFDGKWFITDPLRVYGNEKEAQDAAKSRQSLYPSRYYVASEFVLKELPGE